MGQSVFEIVEKMDKSAYNKPHQMLNHPHSFCADDSAHLKHDREERNLSIFLQACVNGLLMGGFYSLMGMGQNVIFGVMKIVNFCHGEMLMVGMYLTYVLSTTFGLDPYLCVPLVAVIMFCLGAVIQHTLITPSLGTKSFTNLLFLTVGLGLLLSNGALVLFGSEYRTIPTAYAQTYISLGPVNLALPRLISFGVLIVISIVLFAFLKYTTTGKQIRALYAWNDEDKLLNN